MTVDELKKITAIITRAYSSETFDSLKMQLYYDMLKDTDYSLAEKNLMEHINTSSFPPKINELKKPKLSYHDHLKNDARKFLTSPIVTEKKGEPAPGYIKDYMNKRREELKVKNKIEKGE